MKVMRYKLWKERISLKKRKEREAMDFWHVWSQMVEERWLKDEEKRVEKSWAYKNI